MKATAVGTTSGCLIWILAFGLVSLCLCPMAVVIGTLMGAETMANIIGPYLCPENSSAEVITFQTTSTDEFGNEEPATGYEMRCLNSDGTVVREGSPDFAFYWMGILMLGSLLISGGLAFLVAAPLGTFIARRSGRSSPTTSV